MKGLRDYFFINERDSRLSEGEHRPLVPGIV